MLVAEDNKYILTAIEAQLNKYDFEIDTAKDGEEAVAKYKQNASKGKFYTMIYLDIFMPNMNGDLATK